MYYGIPRPSKIYAKGILGMHMYIPFGNPVRSKTNQQKNPGFAPQPRNSQPTNRTKHDFPYFTHVCNLVSVKFLTKL
jgi:hypothetical protein